MPCWQVQSYSVEFNSKRPDLLEAALRSLKLTHRVRGSVVSINPESDWDRIDIDLSTGQAKLRPEYQSTLNSVKRAYSSVVVREVAKVKGWALQASPASPLKMNLRK